MNAKAVADEHRRKRIAIVFPKDSESIFNGKKSTFGGATIQLYNYARELGERHDVYCLINEIDSINPELCGNLNIQFTFHRKNNFAVKVYKFARALFRVKPEVVIQRGLTRISPFLGLFCRVFRIKFIFMFAHDREARGRFQRSDRYNVFYPLLFPFSHYLIVQNDYQKNHMPARLNGKVQKIRNGFPILPPDVSGKNGVLWVSRLEPWKRPEVCIEAARKNPDVMFTMIAPVSDGFEDYAKKIYGHVKKVKNINMLDFVGHREIDGYFRVSKVFLNTSTEEGFPNTFIQACKNMTPIVSLSVNPDSFIDDFGVGEFCGGDEGKLMESIKNILNNETILLKYADAAFNYVKEYHCIKRNAKVLERLI